MLPDQPAPVSAEEPTPIGPARAFVVRTPRRTWAVPLLIALNTAVFLAMYFSGASWNEPGLRDLLRFGASHGPYVSQGDWWRLVACAFVHVGFVHLAINMASLFALRIVESFYGSGAFLLLYLMSALGASACSVLWHPSEVTAGASGAIFGLAGALLAFFGKNRNSIPELLLRPVVRNLVVLIAMLITYGALVPSVDNAAHLGGLVIGWITGRALDRDPQGSARLDSRRLARATIPAILLGLLCFLIPWRSSSASDIRLEIDADQATRELGLGHADVALRIAEDGLARDPTCADLLGVRAQLRSLLGDPRSALTDLNELLYQRPDDVKAHRSRANLLRMLGQHEQALEDAEYLIRLSPDEPGPRQLAGELHWSLGQWREAAIEFGVVARRKGESAIEGQLFLWLARWRMGEEEQATRELRHYLSTPRMAEDRTLDVNIAGLFTGQESLELLIADFDRHSAPAEELGRLYFFVGVWRELKGDAQEAREFLQRAVESSTSDRSIYLLARHELEALEKP
ncbi:MAG: rhomboid family intramembrane serine protease [Planctomycetes bacterium]|nr:rhomboid family intramembrane serine protease [Planctomycetota bacterium]